MSNMSEALHPIQVVVARTGLTAHVIRVWEKRYGAVIPQRTETNRRLYSEDQIGRLSLLRRLSAKVFGILLSLEPAAAALAGLIVLGQVLTPTQLLGMGLVVAASALVLGLGARKDPAESTGA